MNEGKQGGKDTDEATAGPGFVPAVKIVRHRKGGSMARSLASLLMHWVYLESTGGMRAVPLPEYGRRYGVNSRGGLEVIARGLCEARSTARGLRESEEDARDFGRMFQRVLTDREQECIIAGVLIKEKAQWRKYLDYCGMSNGNCRRMIAQAWKKVAREWERMCPEETG